MFTGIHRKIGPRSTLFSTLLKNLFSSLGRSRRLNALQHRGIRNSLISIRIWQEREGGNNLFCPPLESSCLNYPRVGLLIDSLYSFSYRSLVWGIIGRLENWAEDTNDWDGFPPFLRCAGGEFCWKFSSRESSSLIKARKEKRTIRLIKNRRQIFRQAKVCTRRFLLLCVFPWHFTRRVKRVYLFRDER